MREFRIRKGPLSDLFLPSGEPNPRLLIERGCWYLTSDTAELFVGIPDGDGAKLRRINDINDIIASYAKAEVVEAAITAVNSELSTKANIADVYSIVQADSKFVTTDQVRTIVDAVVAEVSNQDTIEGIVNLVEYVNTNASDITALLTDVGTAKAAIEDNKIAIEKIAGQITITNSIISQLIQPKESEEISVSDDGILGIKEVSISKLSQAKDEILILQSGDADDVV